jgi:hypothetical protein
VILHDEDTGQYEVYVYDPDAPPEDMGKSVRKIISCPTLEATLAAQRLRHMFDDDYNRTDYSLEGSDPSVGAGSQ